MKKLVYLFIVISFLYSCTSHEDQRLRLETQSPYELCMGYLGNLDFNRWQKLRAETIAKRNIDCSPYYKEGYALKQKRKDELFESGKKVFEAGVDAKYPNQNNNEDQVNCITQKIGNILRTTCK